MVELSAPMAAIAGDDGFYQLEESVEIRARHAAVLELRTGTHWQRIGKIEYGEVFDTSDQVVIVNSFDVHEAAIVVKDASVVGYFLKVAQTFVAAEPVPIILKRVE